MPVEEQVVSIFAGTGGYLDDIPIADVKRFEQELHEYIRTRHGAILDAVRDTGALPEGDELADAVSAFKEQFQPTEVVETVATEDEGE
jgi:F-type H+-transporting ATPase subunit alpha